MSSRMKRSADTKAADEFLAPVRAWVRGEHGALTKLAKKISAHSPVAIALTRQMMYRNSAQDHPIEAHKVDSLAIFYTSQTSAKEGIPAFLEKRKANFTDKASSDMPDFYPWWD